MKVAASTLVLAFLASSSSAALIHQQKAAEFCSDVTGENLANVEITVTPEPVVIVEGTSMFLHVSMDLLKQVEVGATAKMELIKDGLVPITLPCVDVPALGIGLGSCDYLVQDLLDLASANGFCEDYFQDGNCKLPLKPGHYGGNAESSLEIVFPAIPSMIAPLLDGTVDYKLQIYQPDGSEMACLSGDITLTTQG